MVARLYDGMRRVDLKRPAKGPSESVSREQFTVSMSHLLKGSSREKSFMILKMISATDGPVKAREVQKVGRPRGLGQPSPCSRCPKVGDSGPSGRWWEHRRDVHLRGSLGHVAGGQRPWPSQSSRGDREESEGIVRKG